MASLPGQNIDWQKQIKALLQTHKDEELGQMNTFKATLQLKPEAKPKFCKARSVPFALKPAIDRELDRLKAEGVRKRCHSVSGLHLLYLFPNQKATATTK